MPAAPFVLFVLFFFVTASADSPKLRWKANSDLVNLQGAGGGGVSSSDSDGGDKKGCFAGTEALLLQSGDYISIDKVKVGDRVQVASTDGFLSFADVVFLPHEKNAQPAPFIKIETNSGASLKVTPSHLVLAGSCEVDDMKLTRAEDVAVGECMLTVSGEDVVVNVSKTREKGVYTIVTSHKDGIIVVNGFVASSFSYNHMIANFYYDLHRALYKRFDYGFTLLDMKKLGRVLENMVAGVTF